jgi:hypothetical protein
MEVRRRARVVGRRAQTESHALRTTYQSLGANGEMADTLASGASGSNPMRVQVPLRPPKKRSASTDRFLYRGIETKYLFNSPISNHAIYTDQPS